MAIYRDDGIVLRTHKLGEADRIVTILGRKSGRIRAVAKGVRRTKSRLGARVEPFTHVDLLLYTGRSLDVITQAETIRAYGEPLASDYPRYTTGTAMLETAERLTPVEKEPSLRQFLLLVGGLRALGEGQHDPRLVLDAFLLRSLAVAGYAPALDECAVCGTRAPEPEPREPDLPVLELSGPEPSGPEPSGPEPSGPEPSGPEPSGPEPSGHEPSGHEPSGHEPAGHEPAGAGHPRPGHGRGGPPGHGPRALRSFGIAAGGLTCQACRRPGAATPSIATIALMSALMRGDWELADHSERRHQAECSGLVAAYLQWHLEHSIRSLKHVEHA